MKTVTLYGLVDGKIIAGVAKERAKSYKLAENYANFLLIYHWFNYRQVIHKDNKRICFTPQQVIDKRLEELTRARDKLQQELINIDNETKNLLQLNEQLKAQGNV